MPNSLEISVTKDTAQPVLAWLESQLTREELFVTISGPLTHLFQRHLRALPHNKHHWPPTNFYIRAAEATSAQLTSEGTTIRIAQTGMRQRLFGGPIRPVTKRALAIPISSESYGKSAGDFAGQGMFVLGSDERAWLVRPTMASHAGARAGTRLDFLFRLAWRVRQLGDPKVIPSNDEIADTAIQAIARKLENP